MYHKVSYEKFLSKNLGKTFPEKCSFCNFCDWQTHCNNEWEDKRHVNQLLGNTNKDCKKFISAGITTYDQIANLDPRKKIDGLREEIKLKELNKQSYI